MSLASANRPLWAHLYETAQHLLRSAHLKLPAWTNVAALAFVAGWGGALLYSHSSRRRWRAQSIRTERSIPLLKTVVASCWDSIDAESSGWLDPFEARVCLSHVLTQLQESHTLIQLAHFLVPRDDAASDDSDDPAAIAHQAEVESELRALLSKLLSDLSRRDVLESSFSNFLEHIEARPAQRPHSFTPPINERKPSSVHSPRHRSSSAQQSATATNSNGLIDPPAATNGTSSVASSSSSHSSSPIFDSRKPGRPASTSNASHSSIASAASITSAPTVTAAQAATTLDRKVFRYEFNTAVVIWLESQIIRHTFITEHQHQQPIASIA